MTMLDPMPMTRCQLLVRNARLITLDPAQPPCFLGWMAVGADGRIQSVAAGDAPEGLVAENEIDASEAFVAPGFISAHSHLFTSGSRGLGIDQALYGWGDAMMAFTLHTDAEDIYWCTLHGALDFLGNGITTAYDFTDSRLPMSVNQQGQRVIVAPLKPAAFAESQIKAKVDAGLRFINSVMMNDEEGDAAAVLERFAGTKRYAEKFADTGLYLGSAISGSVQWSATLSTASLEVEAMRRFGVINQPHFLETIQEVELQRSKWVWYRDAGALGPDLIFGHFVQATPDMIREAGRCGCGMVWQPTSNGRLASGFADIPACTAAGMRIGVGLDDQSCTDISDPWQNMRMGIYTQRANAKDPGAMGVARMLHLHTLGSAEVLGIADRVGSLETGKYADFLVVDPTEPDIGPVWNPVAIYVLACGLRNLKAVYVGGALASREGRSTNSLAPDASRELHARLRAIAARMPAGRGAPDGIPPA